MKRGKPLRRYSPLRAKAASLGLRRLKSRGRYKQTLWALMSEYVRRKYADHAGNVICVSCDDVMHWTKAQAGHYLPKSLGLAIYFEERNVHPQCAECNLTLQGNQYRYALFLLKTYGPAILEELDAQRRQQRQIKEHEYLDLIAEYQEKLGKLQKLPEAA